MFTYCTTIKAIDPTDGTLKEWCGPNIKAYTLADAERYCQENGLGYCVIEGRLIQEVGLRGKNVEDFEPKINLN